MSKVSPLLLAIKSECLSCKRPSVRGSRGILYGPRKETFDLQICLHCSELTSKKKKQPWIYQCSWQCLFVSNNSHYHSTQFQLYWFYWCLLKSYETFNKTTSVNLTGSTVWLFVCFVCSLSALSSTEPSHHNPGAKLTAGLSQRLWPGVKASAVLHHSLLWHMTSGTIASPMMGCLKTTEGMHSLTFLFHLFSPCWSLLFPFFFCTLFFHLQSFFYAALSWWASNPHQRWEFIIDTLV